MKQDGGFEPILVSKATSDFLYPLNACVLGLQHAVVHLEPYGIKYFPEIATNHISNSHHGL